jgi:pimeloyl-ACP methyl ester carboxylesterase
MSVALSKGAQIYWRETGAGTPLLLVMGIGYSSDMWHPIEPLLAADHRLILFDNRGVGRSSDIVGAWTISGMADDALAVLDAAGIASAHVFGMSMGGYIAQELVLRFPDRVRSLILGCTSCGGDQAVPAKAEVFNTIDVRRAMLPEDGVRLLNPYIYDPSTPPDRIEVDMQIRLRTYPSRENYDAQLAAIQRWQSSGRLDRITAPTLVLHGEHDCLIPCENGRYLAEMIPGAEYREIENASHIFTTDQPGRTVAFVKEFLAARK